MEPLLLRDLMMMDNVGSDIIYTRFDGVDHRAWAHTYPPTPKFMDMCDEIGFYVMLETDLETHGGVCREAGGDRGYDFLQSPESWLCCRAEWKESFVERMERAYHRDKNHCSIFSWSTGNESGHGDNHVAMIEYIRKNDSKRLVHCENVSRAAALSDYYGQDTTYLMYRADMYSRMYESTQAIEKCALDPEFKTKILEFSNGLRFETKDEFEFNVSKYSAQNLMKALHQDELENENFITVRIDYKNSGIGSASHGPELLEKYRLSEKDIHFEFSIK